MSAPNLTAACECSEAVDGDPPCPVHPREEHGGAVQPQAHVRKVERCLQFTRDMAAKGNEEAQLVLLGLPRSADVQRTFDPGGPMAASPKTACACRSPMCGACAQRRESPKTTQGSLDGRAVVHPAPDQTTDAGSRPAPATIPEIATAGTDPEPTACRYDRLCWRAEELVAEAHGVTEGAADGKTCGSAMLALRAMWRVVEAARLAFPFIDRALAGAKVEALRDALDALPKSETPEACKAPKAESNHEGAEGGQGEPASAVGLADDAICRQDDPRLTAPRTDRGCDECMGFGILPNCETCACGAPSTHENGNCADAMTKHPDGVPCPKCAGESVWVEGVGPTSAVSGSVPSCTCRGYADEPTCSLHGVGKPASAPDARDAWPPTTLEKLSAIRDVACVHEILFRNAGVGLFFYEGPPVESLHDDEWRRHLVVHRYYPTIEEAIDAEWRRLGCSTLSVRPAEGGDRGE